LSPKEALVDKRELDKRETFAEVVADYPKNELIEIFRKRLIKAAT